MTEPTPPKGRYVALALLVVVYALNFLDRQIISILKDPIAEELNLSDTQLGLMGGLAFALLYTTLAVPVAWLADRFSRVWIMTGALALWSGFTALCGLAGNFSQLFLARMGVGVGEAGGVAPAYSLISDYFPPKQRARALAIFAFGIPIGSAAGVLFGGLLAQQVDWRFAFVVVGLIGVLFAPIFRLLVKDPPRGGMDGAVTAEKPMGFLATARLATGKPGFWLLSLGAAFTSMTGYGFMYWLPTFLSRSLEMDLGTRSWFLAALLLIGGMAGMTLGGVLGDRLGQKSRAAYPLIPAVALLICVPLYAVGVNAQAPAVVFVMLLIPQALGLVWMGPVITAVQHLGPGPSRTMMSSLFLLINNLIGIAVGTWFFGFMSDHLRPQYGDDSMKYAFLIGLSFYVIAAGLFFAASRRMKADWVE
ncbi:spinster family MFS transporter [Asticcacaulis endophyticus]|uniref:MFS transporter n=1 Tax=Asticcacaulis endophyticus TaxID=1395890 RepID=A0A918QDU9_9CAUL|nr:MFS transporter [Asticcacaulis endophyticus]GGZ41696.1 MFS transporter [Asticcacaulis endophyticus]